MANSDYTLRPNTHGFCPVGYLSADIGPLDTAVTMTGYTSPAEDGIRIGMAAMITSIIPVDPYADNVVLLVQGGDAGSGLIQDRSPYASSVTASANAQWTNAVQFLGVNALDLATTGPTIPYFSGNDARFSRGLTEDMTVEVFFRFASLPVFTGYAVQLWHWYHEFDVDRLGDLHVDGTASAFVGNLVYRQGGTSYTVASLSANTDYFIQLNVTSGVLTIDVGPVGGATVQMLSVAAIPANSLGNYRVWYASNSYTSATAVDAFVGPLRWTKGVARPRGTTPSVPFQSSSTAFDHEIVVVTARTDNNITLGRGCCDTVPAAHSAGDAIWFFDDSIGSDKLEYAGTETIGVKVLPRVTAGALPIEHAPPAEVEFNLRFARPYPPGLVRVNGAPWFTTPITLSSGTPTLALTWAHRDRITQQDQLIDHLQASIGPETGVTYEARVHRGDGTLLRAVTGLTGTSWSYALADAVSDFSGAGGDYPGYIALRSVRGGLYCLQDYRIDFTLQSSGVTVTEEALSMVVSIPVQPAGGSIAMAYTQAPVAASPGAAMVRFFTPSLTLADPVPAGQTFVINFGQRTNNAGPIYYLAQYQTTTPTTRETIINSLKEQIDYLLINSTTPPLSDYIELASVSDYNGHKWLHIVGQFGVEFMGEGTGQPDPPGVTRPTVTGNNTSMISWSNGEAVVPTALPQIVTATVSGSPAAGDKFTITLNSTTFSRTSLTSESLSTVASALAALIDADPNFSASAAGAVITINGLTHTNVFTYSATSESMFAY